MSLVVSKLYFISFYLFIPQNLNQEIFTIFKSKIYLKDTTSHLIKQHTRS